MIRPPLELSPREWATPDLIAWVSDAPRTSHERALNAMASACRVHQTARLHAFYSDGCSVALQSAHATPEQVQPATIAGYALWMVGEIFEWPAFPDVNAVTSRTLSTRVHLLQAVLDRGPAALREVDGEYVIALWSARERALHLMNDRFGSLAVFYGRSLDGSAIASAARAVAAAPGMNVEPDPDAIREAVTFGGYRLGSRTPIKGIALQTPATALRVTGQDIGVRRYWPWPVTPTAARHTLPEAIEELHKLWKRSVERRLVGAESPGLHLSGGLDSRAVLAELIEHQRSPQTITFGVRRSDEVRCAAAAAAAVKVPWHLVDVFNGSEDWLGARERWIYHTDGMIDLVDLRHVDSMALQVQTLDVHLSGYIGDLLLGSRFNAIDSVDAALFALPYYGDALGFSVDSARQLIADYAAALDGASPRFLIYELKCPQSTNRWTVAWRPWVGVRKPFTSYALFDFCQRMPAPLWRSGIREQWLHSAYPTLFARIPESGSGVPILSSQTRRQAARVRRYAGRQLRRWWPASADRMWHREATPNNVYMRQPRSRDRIQSLILSDRSIAATIFGRKRLASVVHDYFEREAAPTQVIAALYVFEAFHRDLPSAVLEARRASVSTGLTRNVLP